MRILFFVSCSCFAVEWEIKEELKSVAKTLSHMYIAIMLELKIKPDTVYTKPELQIRNSNVNVNRY